ncbi:MAG: hypothetical protein P4L41_06295 [Flavipsychrobacter sp.]|nr:hypothetical protein [Flavipsychrobacter sp.]
MTSLQKSGILLLCIAIASCTNNTTSTTANTDSTAAMGNSTVTTTTTTTTRHTYSGTFQPQPNMKYLDLKTKRQVSVRIDTTTGILVNSETSEPLDLFVSGTDTIYGQTGTPANNYIIRDESGNYSIDQNRMTSGTDMSNTTTADNAASTTTSNPAATDETTTGKEKFKQKANGNTKLKTPEEKIKDKNGVEKVKERY